MGKWIGTAPLQSGGDWTHKPSLEVKFRHSGMFNNPKPDQAVIDKIGAAYSTALVKVADARTKVQLALDIGVNAKDQRLKCADGAFIGEVLSDFFSPHKRKAVDLNAILDILTKTRDGLRDNSEQNRLYLFTKDTKPKDKLAEQTLGYVKRHKTDEATKAHRPDVPTPLATADKLDTTHTRRGHIHLNYDKMKSKPNDEVVITIIHEATHRFCGTCDFAYRSEGKYQNLTDPQLLNNADTHAFFCMAV